MCDWTGFFAYVLPECIIIGAEDCTDACDVVIGRIRYTTIACYHRIEEAVRTRVRVVEGGEDERLAKLTGHKTGKKPDVEHKGHDLNRSQGLNSTMSSVQWASLSDDGTTPPLRLDCPDHVHVFVMAARETTAIYPLKRSYLSLDNTICIESWAY